jgi:formylglycine-generating enzyme required for sulfatase activity
MKMKNTVHALLILMLLFHATQAMHAKGVWGLYSKQRAKSKLVTLTYTLHIDADETAKVEFFFSSDDGANYLPCSTITGDVGDAVTTGSKTAIWDAGADWDGQFTRVGRFKLVYSLNVEPALDFSVVEVPFQASGVFESPSFRIKDSFTYMKTQTFAPGLQSLAPGVPKKYFVDKWEVSNGQWDKVVEWAVKHGYDLEKAPADSKPNYPRVNVSMNEVVKWLNARSEMEGLTPAFYLDPIERRWETIKDGKVSEGPDAWQSAWWDVPNNYGDPNYDWSLIPNGKKHYKDGWITFDPNNDGYWNSGEPFFDRNKNGRFEPWEFEDLNNNQKVDNGLSLVFRKGKITTYLEGNYGSSYGFTLRKHTKIGVNGYRLPVAQGLVPFENFYGYGVHGENAFQDGEFWYLAMGGKKETGPYKGYRKYDYEFGRREGWEERMGLVYEEEWPWGTESPDRKSDLSDSVVLYSGGVRKINLRQGNQAGIQDMLGNVSEMTLNWTMMDTSNNKNGMVQVLGGSVEGLPRVISNYSYQSRDTTPGSVMSVGKEVSDKGDRMVGFRAIRVRY